MKVWKGIGALVLLIFVVVCGVYATRQSQVTEHFYEKSISDLEAERASQDADIQNKTKNIAYTPEKDSLFDESGVTGPVKNEIKKQVAALVPMIMEKFSDYPF